LYLALTESILYKVSHLISNSNAVDIFCGQLICKSSQFIYAYISVNRFGAIYKLHFIASHFRFIYI